MNLSFVEAFSWAATLRSVTRAAEKLHVTQPTVSARLRELERELGAPLLERRDKQFRLTPAGERFVGNAAELLALWRKTTAEISPAFRGAPPCVSARSSRCCTPGWCRGSSSCGPRIAPWSSS